MVVRGRCGALPETAVVLGSGLGDFAERLGDPVAFDYAEIPHWPRSSVIGHAGRLVVGVVAGRRVAAMAGRAHIYEGHEAGAAAFATRVMGRLGVRRGHPHERGRRHQHDLRTGRAHGDRRPHQPARDESAHGTERRAVRAALSGYDRGVFAARAASPTRRRAPPGVPLEPRCLPLAVPRPELRDPGRDSPSSCERSDADAVGMSTVPEAIAARHIGHGGAGRVSASPSSVAAGVLPQPLDHDEVLETAAGETAGSSRCWRASSSGSDTGGPKVRRFERHSIPADLKVRLS